MGLDVTSLKGYKPPLPNRGTYDLKIKEGRDFVGKADDNDEKSRGFAFKYVIEGPAYATMSDGSSAIGFEFEELVTLPRAALEASNAKAARGMKQRVLNRIEASFGEDFPGEVSGKDFTGKVVKADLYTQFDNFAGEVIAKIDKLLPATPF